MCSFQLNNKSRTVVPRRCLLKRTDVILVENNKPWASLPPLLKCSPHIWSLDGEWGSEQMDNYAENFVARYFEKVKGMVYCRENLGPGVPMTKGGRQRRIASWKGHWPFVWKSCSHNNFKISLTIYSLLFFKCVQWLKGITVVFEWGRLSLL